MHAHFFFVAGKSAQLPIELKLRYSRSLQNRHFNSQAVILKHFKPCWCSADDGGTAVPPLPPPPNLKGKAPRKFWNAASLAFLGDSVWELYIRRKNFYPPSRVSDYYAVVVSQVRAEAQSAAYKTLDTSDFLTSEERDVLRWGRNATGTSPKRLSQGGMTKQIYREATAIECLAGYLYLTDALRLHEVMIQLGIESIEN